MSYQAKDYSKLIPNGISQKLMDNHITLYQGYVKNTNLLAEKLHDLPKDSPEYGELHRRFGWEFNGMRLHELFFENIIPKPITPEEAPELFNKIQQDFGSIEDWIEDFKSIGMMRGIGWIILYHDKWQDKLFNTWINEHDTGHLAGCRPLFVVDVFEHAYMPDGLRKPDYLELILSQLNWQSANERMKAIA